MIVNALCQPHNVKELMAIIIRLIWVIEEYAIRAFKSIWEVQIIAVIRAPQIAIVTIKFDKELILAINIEVKRIKPYPPSFKRIPANIIDPTTGASTWAFGNHKWNKKIGNFTMNTIVNAIQRSISDEGCEEEK